MSAGSVAAVFGASFALSLSTSIPAWPLPGIVSRESRRHGLLGGLAVLAGHLVPDIALFAALLLLFGQFGAEDWVVDVLFVVGGVVVIWSGVWTVALSLGRGSPFSNAYPAGEDDRSPLGRLPKWRALSLAIGSLAITVVSIEWFAFWLTARAALLAHATNNGVEWAGAFAAGHWLADAGWPVLVGMSVALGERLMQRQTFRGVIAACGLVLVALGAGFMYTGLAGD
jgi:hypothetical protein